MPPKNPLPSVNEANWQRVNKSRDWYQFPVAPVLLKLRALRDELRELNKNAFAPWSKVG
jgi:hypothetical protein